VTEAPGLYQPDWRLPSGVRAFVTTRSGGHSTGPWSSFNLGGHVGDAPEAVAANRRELLVQLSREAGVTLEAIQWVQQVHGTSVFRAEAAVRLPPPQADAICTSASGLVLGVLTADCLPVLFCTADGSEIAVAHAGWRGLLAGVLEATLAAFTAAPADISAWLGPAIGPCHFEVGDEVRTAFMAQASSAPAATAAAFRPAGTAGKWFADLYQLARIRLHERGVANIGGEVLCTSCNTVRFYSYRQQRTTGRFATLILKSS
jgi:hypothetical protein